MDELTKEEQLTDERLAKILSETQAVINERNAHCKTGGSVEVNARIFESMLAELQRSRQMLAGLEQEPVGEVVLGDYDDCGDYPDAKVVCIAAQGQADWNNFRNGTRLYAAPQLPQPAVVPHPVSAVKGELAFIDHFERIIGERDGDIDIGQLGRGNYDALMLAALDAFRATMLHGAEPPAYEIKRFGEFGANGLTRDDGELAISIQLFKFERGTTPELERGVIVEKYALQAIINALQQQCDRLSDAPIPVIWPAVPQQEDL